MPSEEGRASEDEETPEANEQWFKLKVWMRNSNVTSNRNLFLLDERDAQLCSMLQKVFSFEYSSTLFDSSR